MPYQTSGTLTSSKLQIDDQDGWDTQTEWEAYQSLTGVEINSGAVELAFYEDAPTSMFASPLYQWWGASISASAGTSPVDWPESLAGLPDATAVGGPTKRSQSGLECVEYDGTDDGHTWSADASLPTGDTPWSIFALAYLPSSLDNDILIAWGNSSTLAEYVDMRVNSGTINITRAQDNFYGGGTPATGQWVTLGGRYDGNGGLDVGYDGTFNNTHAVGSYSLTDENHSFAHQASGSAFWFDGYIAELIVCDADESGQAFTDYHNDRLPP